MFYLVLFCKFLITNECAIVFGRQGPEVRILSPRPVIRKKVAFVRNKRPFFVNWEGIGTEDKVHTEASAAGRQADRREAHLLTPTNFSD